MPVEQIGNALIAEAYYTASGNVATGLTVTCDVDKLVADGTYAALVTGAAATEGRNGIYFYILASGSVDAKAVYNFVFKAPGETVDQEDIVAAWTAGQTWVENVDAASSTLATAIALETLRTILARSSVAGSIDANELTLIRGDSYDSDTDNAIEGLGDISNRINLWVVVKKSTALTDLQATIFAEETAGITRLNGVAYTTTGHSIITVSDEVAGDLRWQLDEVVTNALTPGLYFYDIQTLDNAGAVKTWRQVKQFTVLPDVARVIV